LVVHRFFGWDPADGSGGVWALEHDVDDEEPPETARLRMAITMKERCKILERLGAVFYQDGRESPELNAALAMFKPCKCEMDDSSKEKEG
jgi:hypothetical protein